ncbi:MAG: PDZ domain-containing protein [Phycisphaerales bacterium]|nr:PDZ domain-containing protein [Phycisphaerales bacterium]
MIHHVLFGLIGVLVGMPAVVQADTPAPPRGPDVRLSRFIQDMNSADWRTREEATVELALDRDVTETLITQRLGRAGLTHEQRLRLLRAIETRLLQLPRGALGIRMKIDIVDFQDQDGNRIRGVEILELLPGMPAEAHLRVGDVIMSIEGELIDQSSEVSELIKRHWPGEPIELEIARDLPADAAGLPRRSQRLQVKVNLGSTEQLDSRQTGGRGWNEQRQVLEQKVRRYYDRYAPRARPLLPPEEGVELPKVSDLSIGYDPSMVLQQIIMDRTQLENGAPGSLSRVEFRAKWEGFARDITLLIETSEFDDESRQIFERLRSRVLELADLED